MPKIGASGDRASRDSFSCSELPSHGYEHHCPYCGDTGYEMIKAKVRSFEKHKLQCADGCTRCDEVVEAATPCVACHSGQTIRKGLGLERKKRKQAERRHEKVLAPHEEAQVDRAMDIDDYMLPDAMRPAGEGVRTKGRRVVFD